MTMTDNVFGSLDLTHLVSVAEPTLLPQFTGSWATVELQPDTFVPQRFTVGVAVQSVGERMHFKLLDDVKKFECVYQGRFSQRAARELLAYAEEALRRAVHSRTSISEVIFDTHCLTFGPVQFTSGADQEATVERLFSEVVVMSATERTKSAEFESLDTPSVRQLVNTELKRIARMDFEKIVTAENQGILLDYEGQKHFLDLNLLTPKGCGSVTSAVYKTAQSVEMNLLKTSRDLTTYSRIRDLDSIGLFLLTPEEGALEPKEFKKIEAVIHEHEWKLERDGFRVVSLDSPSGLAQEIYDWAKPALSR